MLEKITSLGADLPLIMQEKHIKSTKYKSDYRINMLDKGFKLMNWWKEL